MTQTGMRAVITIVLLLLSTTLGGTAPADASPPVKLEVLSGPSPFAPHGCGHLDRAVIPDELGHESATAIAVHPLHPGRAAAAWLQDAGLGVVVAFSNDAGNNWTRAVVPGLTICNGGTEDRVLEPRISFGPDGVLYLAASTVRGFFPDPRSGVARIIVTSSPDGGATWATPTFVEAPTDVVPQFDTMTAEPDVAGVVDVVWHGPEPELNGATYLSRSTDGGTTWERTIVRESPQEDALPNNRISALPNGTLLVAAIDASAHGFFADGFGLPGGSAPSDLMVFRSTDKGTTWSSVPVVVANNALPTWPSAAVGPNGEVYLVWPGLDEQGSKALFIATSTDGGQSWTEGVRVTDLDVAASPPRFRSFPGVTVDKRGVVGFAHTRRVDATGDPTMRRVWFSSSQDGGITWSEIAITTPFSMAERDQGPYQETAAFPWGFGAVFQVGSPLATNSHTDVMFARIHD